ncbi:MAG: Crp/Fnr family transcriptional regulator [Deltaproteobacteria bacterium]|nr:Crp/Fnr family transcriptional regulator [Deltaproteobacteria bacterium]
MLKDIALFSALNDDELRQLQGVAVTKVFPRNTIIINEGDSSTSIYVILSGQVKVVLGDERGNEMILSILGPGEYFGELALLDGEPRSACVMARERTEALVISRNDFVRIFSLSPKALGLLRGLTERLRDANEKIRELAFMDVYSRVARLITQQAAMRKGHLVVEGRMTHQEMAQVIGASREMVTRILKKLTEEGYISVERQKIEVHKNLPYTF